MTFDRCYCIIIRPSSDPYLCAYCYSISTRSQSYPRRVFQKGAGLFSSVGSAPILFRIKQSLKLTLSNHAVFSLVPAPFGGRDAVKIHSESSTGENNFATDAADEFPTAQLQRSTDWPLLNLGRVWMAGRLIMPPASDRANNTGLFAQFNFENN